jgi:GMP synthase (glutamine-hydrolysing)
MITTLSTVDDYVLEEIAEEMRIRQTDDVFLFFPLGSQFDHLIMLELGKLGIFAISADPKSITSEAVSRLNPKGIILSGGPASVYNEEVPFDTQIFDLKIPVLGICLGFQLWAKHVGCNVIGSEKREYGRHFMNADTNTELLRNCSSEMIVLESHGDQIEVHSCLTIIGSTKNTPVSVATCGHLFGVQFHPETSDTPEGSIIFENFCFTICGGTTRFKGENIAEKKVLELREKIGQNKVVLALSGGSDSSVVAMLLEKALGEKTNQVLAIYIKGIDRPDDETAVQKYFGNKPWLTLKVIDATEEFLKALAGKITMKDKRIAMRGVYKDVLEKEITKFGASFIAQGTLYTDISESGGGSGGARKAQIKLHHNINLNFSVSELTPLDDQVKDTARAIGRSISVPEELLIKHPFPGPGLVVRIEGEITSEKLQMVREIDKIYIEALHEHSLYHTVWQAGATLLDSTATYTKGDDAGSGHVICLWAVWSVNGFTAQSAELPFDFLRYVTKRIVNEVSGIASVGYRTSDKPPTTIEWG